MPSVVVSFCWSRVLYCPNSSPVRCTRCSFNKLRWLLLHRLTDLKIGHYKNSVVAVRGRKLSRHFRLRACKAQIRTVNDIVRLPIHNGSLVEIFGERWRSGLPFEAGCGPGIRSGNLAIAHRPREIDHRQEIAKRKNRSARGGHDVEHLKFRRVIVIAARHAEAAKNELREECEIEADEENDRGGTRKEFRLQTASNLRPPEVKTADVTHHRAADHDVVEVRDDEIRVVQMNIEAQASKEKASEATDRKQADKAEGVKHRRVPRNGTLV